MKKLEIGLHKRFFNNNLKKAIEEDGLTADKIKQAIGMQKVTISRIINFHDNPTEDQKIALAGLLLLPVDDLFPEHYTAVYERISGIQRQQMAEVSPLSLESGEVLALADSGGIDETDKKISSEMLKHAMEKAIQALDPRERKIIKMRFGMGEWRQTGTHTYEETGKEFGVTRERVRQVEMRALERMKSYLQSHEDEAVVVADYIAEYLN